MIRLAWDAVAGWLLIVLALVLLWLAVGDWRALAAVVVGAAGVLLVTNAVERQRPTDEAPR